MLQRLGELFAESTVSDVVAAWLFGSFARGDARAHSDIVVGVLYRRTPEATFDALPLRLEGEIERLLGRTTQVVALNRAPADLRARVLLVGVLLIDRDPSFRIRFEVQTRNEWFDLQPILREYRRLEREAGRVTDPELLAKRLAVIESCVRELRELARPAAIATDVREARFVEHTLQLALQATLDSASHIVSDERLGEPRTNRELFDRLEQAGWLEPTLAGVLRDMAGFRNILVHGYDTVDLAIVRDVVEHRLDDLLEFAESVRQGLALRDTTFDGERDD